VLALVVSKGTPQLAGSEERGRGAISRECDVGEDADIKYSVLPLWFEACAGDMMQDKSYPSQL